MYFGYSVYNVALSHHGEEWSRNYQIFDFVYTCVLKG